MSENFTFRDKTLEARLGIRTDGKIKNLTLFATRDNRCSRNLDGQPIHLSLGPQHKAADAQPNNANQ